ncbi:MAG: hypothetical protein JST08_18720 [Actinobacteria bacterium]|nr:hypothetical protein [Actinomycetota bacterium]
MSARCTRVLAPLILASALVALLLAPVGAGAAATQFGSSLAAGPAGAFGCNAKPSLYDYSGNFGLFANNEPGGCTWSQAGVWGLNSGSDPRTRSVPSDGRIVGAEVLSGANPSPISITIFSQLAQPGMGSACCFFVSDTGPFQLAPNAITTLPLDIPVERNTKEGVLGVDLVSVSAENDGGSLPLRVVGPSNVLSIPDGDPMAGAFYPRLGRIANDSKGGRHEIQEGVPGIELLVRWTFCAAGDVTCTPGAAPGGPTPAPQPGPTGPTPAPKGPGGGTGGAPVPRPAANQAPVQGGDALVRLICGADVACEGRLSLLAPTAAASAAGGKGKAVVYGGAAYKLAAGAKGTVKVSLNARGKKLLRKHAKATVTLRLAPKGGGTATTTKLILGRAL